jgi:hypothetical protein
MLDNETLSRRYSAAQGVLQWTHTYGSPSLSVEADVLVALGFFSNAAMIYSLSIFGLQGGLRRFTICCFRRQRRVLAALSIGWQTPGSFLFGPLDPPNTPKNIKVMTGCVVTFAIQLPRTC